MNNTKKQIFYQLLQDIFVGAKIEGEGGFINLRTIKSEYYKKIIQQFKKEVEKEDIISDSFEEEFFDKLYNFFHTYFSASGSIYFCNTPYSKRIYEQIYNVEEDTVLFWKTHMLYYIKTEVLFNSLLVSVNNGSNYHFFFDVSGLEHKKSNEKKQLIYSFVEKKTEENKQIFVLKVSYSKNGNTTKFDELSKNTRISEESIEEACKNFEKQNKVDYFINKNAKNFLQNQLNFFLHEYLLNEENKFEQKRLTQLKILQHFALRLIDFVSQFEEELVRIWNKPKFVKNSNYVISLEKLSGELLQKIGKHSNFSKQVKEWQELEVIEQSFQWQDIFTNGKLPLNPKFKTLPLDTKYFKDLELEILAQFSHLDQALDGCLIKSENYQALMSLKQKYKEKVKCIYIDPPYNTGSDDFLYADKLNHSSWITFMNNRLQLAKELLREDGIIFVQCDDNEQAYLKVMMDEVFGRDNFAGTLIHQRAKGGGNAKYIVKGHDYICIYSKKLTSKQKFIREKIIQSKVIERDGKNFIRNDDVVRKVFGKYDKSNDRRCFYEELSLYKNKKQIEEIQKKINKGIYELEKNNDNKTLIVEYKCIEESYSKLYSIIKALSENGTKHLNELGLNFENPKPEEIIKYIIHSSTQKGDIILDYHLGSGTTAAVAHKMERKYIGIELAEDINKIAIKRIKKVIAGEQGGISKEVNWQGKGFFHYYELEQYEDTINNMHYQEQSQRKLREKEAFEEYIFFADKKFSDVLQIEKNNKIKLDFNRLYQNIDFAETLSNIYGRPIKRKTKQEVVLDMGADEKIIPLNTDEMNDEQKLKLLQRLKPLLWWGK